MWCKQMRENCGMLLGLDTEVPGWGWWWADMRELVSGCWIKHWGWKKPQEMEQNVAGPGCCCKAAVLPVASAAASVPPITPQVQRQVVVPHLHTWCGCSLMWNNSSTLNHVTLERFPEGQKYTLIKGQLMASEGGRFVGAWGELLPVHWGELGGPGWCRSAFCP